MLDQIDQHLYKLCQKFIKEMDAQAGRFPSLPISDLNMVEVQTMLGLKLTLEDPELDAVPALEVSPEMSIRSSNQPR